MANIVPSGQLSTGWRILAQSAVGVSAPANTNENVLATITIPAGALGPNGTLRVWTTWSYTNSGNNKIVRARFGGASGTQYLGITQTTTTTLNDVRLISNRGATNSQVGSMAANQLPYSTSATAVPTSSVDTTADITLVITGEKASAGDTLTLERYVVEVAYGA